ncbi:hypothetical protein GCM10022223_46930 [Kineosporia mesophila]|uniref:Uncharacterized protein n=1 Tax=Kineosporia mesophila TaxID=566012 RepID=A0ABP7A410_9ACTN|nr:hypothetical protein [Kineosporia mesophila]MCD5353802.1 hypothetical protein [Kineosporia mesophila]
MAFKFKALRLPFVRISDGKSGRTVTWHVGGWSYNSRTGKQSVKLGKNARWESKTRAQKTKNGRYTAKQVEQMAAKERRDAERTAQRQEWRRKIAAGEVEGLKVPADVRARPGRNGSGARKTTGQKGKRAGASHIVHKAKPVDPQNWAVKATAHRRERAELRAQLKARQQQEEIRAIQQWRASGLSATEIDERHAQLRSGLETFAALEELRLMRMQEQESSAQATEQAAPQTDQQTTAPKDQARGGMCGAPTQDGTPCRNAKGGCPHHKNGAARSTAQRARRRS